MAKIVTLTTDWNNSDYYVGAVKSTILSGYSDAVFVDISHQIEQYNWQQAAFIVRSLVNDFPEGTIHIIGVASEPDPNTKIIVAIYHGQYFICTDNGTLGIVFREKPEKVISVDAGSNNSDCCFIEKNVFAEIAKYILLGHDISRLGEAKDDVLRYTEIEPQIRETGMIGSVVYIDSYGNAITNISQELFEDAIGDNKFEILINSRSYSTSKISNSYKDVEPPDVVCIFNSLGLLEIAMREASAKNLMGLRNDSKIRIDIKK